MMEALIAACLLAGTFFTIVAAFGILRMPDIYMRIHAVAKAGTVGIGFVFLSVALFFKDMTVISRVIGIMLFLIVTTPAAAHMLGKTMMESKYPMWRSPDREPDRKSQ